MNKMSAMTLGIMAVGVAAAQAGNDSKLFDELDVNKDGHISTYEAESNVKLLEQFKQLDANGDGRLSRQEFAAFRQQEQ